MQKEKKNWVSITACVDDELFQMLSDFCVITGQSKTVALERAIEKYCKSDDMNTLSVENTKKSVDA